MRRLLVPVAAGLSLIAAGCGSSGSSTSSATSTAAPAATAAPAPSSGKTVAIGMRGIQFTAKQVTVKLGQTVKWTNLEDIPHNVTADSGATFKSATFGKGKSYTFTPKKAGTITYECTIHPGMVGTLTVVK